MKDNKGTTPVMRQFWDIKRKYPDNIILFRMGDFYETFDEDANISSSILGITLTKRSNGAASAVPLAGFPYHALEQYIHKLTKAGYSVAICEQVEDPKTVKGIVKREVVEIVTPGTSISDKYLKRSENNFLLSIFLKDNNAGVSILDISTGDFLTVEIQKYELKNIILQYEPKEILVSDSQENQLKQILDLKKYFVSTVQDWVWESDIAQDELIESFKVKSLKGFGIQKMKNSISSSGALLFYLKNKLLRKTDHISKIKILNQNNKMMIDSSTIRNLEIFDSIQNQTQDGTLIKIIDKTITASGSRLLKQRLRQPLVDISKIQNRYKLVEGFIKNESIRNNVTNHLKEVADIERILSKISSLKSNPRDLKQLAISLNKIDKIKNEFHKSTSTFIKISQKILDLSNIVNEINKIIIDEPPITISKGRFVKKGFSKRLDEYKEISDNGSEWLIKYQKKQKDLTGINSLKIGFNKVFGYYIDITKTHKDKVPENYIRKQTLTNSERFFTEELKLYEEKILSSEEQMISIEGKIFSDLCEIILLKTLDIYNNSKVVASIDVGLCASIVAINNNYVKPIITNNSIIKLKDSRHPVIEKLLPDDDKFVSNDILMSQDKKQIAIITGPNMAGKSTFLRQIALIVLMAQIGFYVPAKSAELGIVDKLFSRVGASDNLVGGESTFMVEMNETANILNNATNKSLVILDEIGRGTSTYDGLSIAWSVTEFLHDQINVSPITLFATHYHELVELANELSKAFNLTVKVKEMGNEVLFLRKIISGGADKSYGIQVADMAGIPKIVVNRANQILNNLLLKNNNETIDIDDKNLQTNLFEVENQELKNKLMKIDVNNITPLQALSKLEEIIKDL
tara:strand:- start:52 stop:2631 length:2580 start_codon:yes stop_codon:yes gene_type:complete